eukprot:scaffold9608_cov119-Skeletonema_dohrnii-CCMP3373.AAC.4
MEKRSSDAAMKDAQTMLETKVCESGTKPTTESRDGGNRQAHCGNQMTSGLKTSFEYQCDRLSFFVI